MRKLIFAFLICTSMSAAAQKTNFSGNWLINKTRTNFSRASAAEWVVPKTIKVDQQAAQLILTRISTDGQLQQLAPITETLAFDGTPFQRVPASGATVTTTIHWLGDTSFTLTRKGAASATETWTLEDNGKTLVIDYSVDQADGGSYKIKCYYDRQ